MNSTNDNTKVQDEQIHPPTEPSVSRSSSIPNLSYESIMAVQDLDLNGDPIVLANARIDKANPSGPFYAKNYASKVQTFDTVKPLATFERPGCEIYYGDSTMTEVKTGDSIWYVRKVPFKMRYHKVEVCPCCKGLNMTFVNCIKLECERYGHFCHDLTGWLETKVQYKCESCQKYSVFIEREYVFIQSGYYELSASAYDTKTLVKEDNPRWRYATPDYWTGVKGDENRNRHTWDGKCFCCSSMTSQAKDASEGAVGACGNSSLYGATFCANCDLLYSAAEHD